MRRDRLNVGLASVLVALKNLGGGGASALYSEADFAEITEWDVTLGECLEETTMTVRAKFTCNSVRKYRAQSYDPATKTYTPTFQYEADFNAVTSGSEENVSFFASTPTGTLKMSTIKDDLFVPGQAYYLDFTAVED